MARCLAQSALKARGVEAAENVELDCRELDGEGSRRGPCTGGASVTPERTAPSSSYPPAPRAETPPTTGQFGRLLERALEEPVRFLTISMAPPSSRAHGPPPRLNPLSARPC